MDSIDGARLPILIGAFASKDIEDVMAWSADLVRPVTWLRPPGVVKG